MIVTSEVITYAKIGGPPVHWHELQIYERVGGELVEVTMVVEVDTIEGFVVRMVTDEQGKAQVNPNNHEEIWMETIHSKNFVILSENIK